MHKCKKQDYTSSYPQSELIPYFYFDFYFDGLNSTIMDLLSILVFFCCVDALNGAPLPYMVEWQGFKIENLAGYGFYFLFIVLFC